MLATWESPARPAAVRGCARIQEEERLCRSLVSLLSPSSHRTTVRTVQARQPALRQGVARRNCKQPSKCRHPRRCSAAAALQSAVASGPSWSCVCARPTVRRLAF